MVISIMCWHQLWSLEPVLCSCTGERSPAICLGCWDMPSSRCILCITEAMAKEVMLPAGCLGHHHTDDACACQPWLCAPRWCLDPVLSGVGAPTFSSERPFICGQGSICPETVQFTTCNWWCVGCGCSSNTRQVTCCVARCFKIPYIASTTVVFPRLSEINIRN